MKAIIVMSASDNVGNAIEDIVKGDTVAYEVDGERRQFTALADIPFGFKAAVKDIALGGDIVKYKETVGRAAKPIRVGECVHIHNVEGKRGRGDLTEVQA
jgi:altronate dehydratase small subunit